MKKDEAVESLYLTQSQVLDRAGWSKGLVRTLLGEPDLRKKIWGRSQLACLYREERVLAAERSVAFQSAQATLSRRRLAGAKAARTKTVDLLERVARMPVQVHVISPSRLKRQAIDSYNTFHWDSDQPASPASDPSFLDRICVNFIRHELTDYDASLEEVAGRTGVQEAVWAIRDRIFDAITAAYPTFAEECQRQKASRCQEPY